MDDSATQIDSAVAPDEGDSIVVTKRLSAFAGSDLHVVLRSLEVGSLVLTGIATCGVVLFTVRQAADLDYELTVLRDGCLKTDPEVHRILLDKVFPHQARVMGVDEWIESLKGESAG